MRLKQFLSLLVLCGLAACFPIRSSATPYASSVRNTTGNTWEFVLNESADNVTVNRTGSSPVNLGALAAGRYTFDMTGATAFDIKVAKNAPVAWTPISSSSNLFTNFHIANGIVTNNNVSNGSGGLNPYFGVIYVANGDTVSTRSGRAMGDGVYALTADEKGVDLGNNFAVVTNANDTTQAKAPSWTLGDRTVGTTTYSGAASAFRLNIDANNNLIVGDWSNANGGVKYATPDLQHGGPLLRFEDAVSPLLMNESNQVLHGAMVSRPYVVGSVGNNMTLIGMDEDMPIAAGTGNHVWRWKVGNTTNLDPALSTYSDSNGHPDTGFAGGYNGPPVPLINVSKIPANTDNSSNFLDLNIGVLANMTYSQNTKKFYLTQNRNAGAESGIAIVTAGLYGDYNNSGAVDAGDYILARKLLGTTTQLSHEVPGTTPGMVTQDDLTAWRARFGDDAVNAPDSEIDSDHPNLVWSSRQWTIDHGLDGDNVATGVQDVFRNMGGETTLTPDGKYLVIHRLLQDGGTNTVMGLGGGASGAVILVPLDANGVPVLTVSGGQITNVASITTDVNNGSGSRRGIAMDAAGNIYTTFGSTSTSATVNAEEMQVFSPGGNWIATTSSNGTFSLLAGSGVGSASVPEPASFALALVGLMASLGVRRRR
jgi:MYXO-CTERM domain-containing protein